MTDVVQQILEEVHAMCVADTSGAVADYIPELAAADPDRFGICLTTADGHVYEVGDTDVPFTIQSVSKPFTYALALSDRGEDDVASRIDVEPSGEPFNEISLDPVTERPRNPMINAGAITSASLVAGDTPSLQFGRIRESFSRYAGRELTMNAAVHASESRTGHRNRAIGHMLRSFGIITDDPDSTVDLYFRQCSLDVTCRDVSIMAATLANNGLNPCTEVRALDPVLVERVLSVMTTCGMYDGAGDWVNRVGLPAKSGVAGAVMAVLPGQLGISVFSPRLDAHGNSVRGVMACRELSRRLELHFLHVGRAARSAVRAEYSVGDTPSRRRRTAAEQETLAARGRRVRVFELHGDLLFAAAESVVRAVSTAVDQGRDAGTAIDGVILDMRRVDDVSGVARSMLDALAAGLRRENCAAVLVDPRSTMAHTVSSLSEHDGTGRVFDDLDSALRWGEDTVLDRWCGGARQPTEVTLDEHPIIAGLDEIHRRAVTSRTTEARYDRGTVIARIGDPPLGLAMVLSGRVAVDFVLPDGTVRAVSTLSAGMSFGEMPLVRRSPFGLRITAAKDTEVALLSPKDFDALTETDPHAKSALLEILLDRAYEQAESIVAALRRSGIV
ncbi:glutaminase [Rhodococcus sp. Leaf7]|uniref:glutaminase A n=1 Tax=unclassified Rhodococcus (in: high G+C Gram-positive bacteria) TaxID=192944 RepID=UPI0005ABBFD6|nr:MULTISPECIES: glutaminase A [unclassified Rhodococcus (in: high G+C Gram-positive bacteria)]KIQ20783.1 glutaminase [Rhodococcus sp. MEB064]KQU03314.1 glutaminase [Rhodococcus sp. Leaf7]KQU39015.1 glutaminase [Rhodococcus sp. Leaf247]